MTDGWPHEASPFHKGEQAVQQRAGVRERAEMLARNVVRDHMPDQHRDFYETLPFLVLASVDHDGQPWASLVAGPPGFLTSPDPTRLSIKTTPLKGDPLNQTLASGAPLGVLGIEPATRRRNRMAGTAQNVCTSGFDIDVIQAFGNCPKFIQTRDFDDLDKASRERKSIIVEKTESLDERAQDLIRAADTFFIASSYQDDSNSPANGADISHRGGKPGFVKIENERSLLFPDFKGNNHFNTLGNLLLNPKAGLLFIDFDNCDLLYLAGQAEVIWEGDAVKSFEGAERLVRFEIARCIRSQNALPFKVTFNEFSPFLNKTGNWL